MRPGTFYDTLPSQELLAAEDEEWIYQMTNDYPALVGIPHYDGAAYVTGAYPIAEAVAGSTDELQNPWRPWNPSPGPGPGN